MNALALLSAMALAAEPDVLARLGSEDWQTWHGAAFELASADARTVGEIAREVVAGHVPKLHAEVAFQNLTEPKARRALAALLTSRDVGLREAAASALGELREASAAPALAAALEREARGPLAWAVARALWQAAPDEQSADRILVAARAAPPELRFSLFDLLEPPLLRARLDVDERLGYLLDHVLPSRTASVSALEIRLGGKERSERLADDEDLAFLEAHREIAAARALSSLERERSAWSALFLGHLKDERALPILREAFLEVHDFYGWETSRPCPLDQEQYPQRYAFEQAIGRITGKPLEASVQLTTPEIWSCARRPDGLYILYRLKPEAALEMAASRLRKTPRDPAECCTRLELADALADHLLRPGMSADHLRVLLGRPARVEGDLWRYPVDETTPPLALELRFASGKLISSKLNER